MSNGASEPIRVLHVDDNRDMGEMVAMQLERRSDAIAVANESSATAGLAHLADGDVDCVVSDHDMPGENGLEFLRDVRESYPDLPFILFTGKGSEEIASDAISAGVTEYLQKGSGTDQYAVLVNRIERAVSANRAERALQESERRLSTLISNLPGMVYRSRNERGWPMTFVSDGARDLTGYSPAAIESGRVNWGEDVILEADREEMWDEVQTAVVDDEPFEVTYRIETTEGEVRWMWERGRVVDTEGETAIIEGFVTDITARREHERELEAEREFSENVINSLDDVFYVVTPSGDFLRWNDRFTEVTGYSDDEIDSMDVFEFFPEEYHEEIVDSTTRAIESDDVAEFEAEIETKGGDRIHFECRGTPVYDVDDDLVGICGVGRDVSERKARESRLRTYEMLVDSVGDAMYVLDADGEIEMVNDAMADALCLPRESIVGRSPSAFMSEADVATAEETIRSVLADDGRTWATFEMRTHAADGTVTDCEDKIGVLTDEDGRFEGSIGVIRDIAARKERERELERYETIIQAIGDPVYTLDEDGVITFVNGAMEDISGYSQSELLGEHIATIMVEEDLDTGEQRIRDLVAHEDRAYDTFETDVVTVDGEHVPCENHIALLPFDDGAFRGTAGVVREISGRRERERRLEEFASVVSHDLRNPLNVVQGRIQIALETGDVEDLGPALDAAGRIERLVDDIVRLTRPGRDPENVDAVAIADAARDAWNRVDADEASLTVEAARTVDADPKRLRELFENLFENAVRHGTRDGERDGLAVRVGDVDDGFFVEDDGVGIDPGRRDDVFERGFTTSRNGTGFGLPIVETIATGHDWTVSVTDAEEPDDAGTRFEIRF